MIRHIFFLLRHFLKLTLKGIETKGLVRIQKGVRIVKAPNSKLIIGRNVLLKENTILFVKNGASLCIGDNTSTGHDTEITCGKSIVIGSDVIMGAYTYVTDADHDFSDPLIPIRKQSMLHEEVSISNNVWIGRGAFVLKGSSVGSRSVIAAGAVVNKKFKTGNMILGGIPAKCIKEI